MTTTTIIVIIIMFPVQRHVRRHQMIGTERRHEGQLAGQHGAGDHPRQLAGIGARGLRGVRAVQSQHVQTGLLRGQRGASADGAHLYAGHHHGDAQVAVLRLLHGGEAGGALHVLSRVLHT